jgi:hypothetical protein
MFREWREKRKLKRQLTNCNFEMAKSILIKKFSGGVIPKELAYYLDNFVANPCFDTAYELMKFDPQFISVFELSQAGGFTERLFSQKDIDI